MSITFATPSTLPRLRSASRLALERRRVLDEPPVDEGGEIARPNTDGVDDPDVRQLAARAEAVHGRGRDAELLGDLGHAQEAVPAAVQDPEVGQPGGGGARR